jgi:hypothetical protein
LEVLINPKGDLLPLPDVSGILWPLLFIWSYDFGLSCSFAPLLSICGGCSGFEFLLWKAAARPKLAPYVPEAPAALIGLMQ